MSHVAFGREERDSDRAIPIAAPTLLTEEQIPLLKAKLDEYTLERAHEHYGALNMWVDSTLSPEGHYRATVHVVAKGYAKELVCKVTFANDPFTPPKSA